MMTLCLMVGLACTPGPARVTRADRPEPAQANARCLWCYDAVIATMPASPRPGDHIRVLCAAVWSDSCVPVYSCHELQDGTIRVISVCSVPPGTGCLTVLTPFCHFASVGPLPTGTYRVEWYIVDLRLDDVLRLCATADFEVAQPPYSLYLPLLPKAAGPEAALGW